jgi:predicted nuclease of predicted toxin-antitoxin system
VRFLLDQNRSPRLAVLLRQSGHDAVHTLDLGLAEAEDEQVLAAADDQDRVLVSGDTDWTGRTYSASAPR